MTIIGAYQSMEQVRSCSILNLAHIQVLGEGLILPELYRSMSGDNRQLFQMNRLSLRNTRWNFKTSGNSPIIYEE